MMFSYALLVVAGGSFPLQSDERVSPALIAELGNKRRNLFVTLPKNVRGPTPDRLADIEVWSQADAHVADGRNEWYRQSAYAFFPRNLQSLEEIKHSVIHDHYRLSIVSKSQKASPYGPSVKSLPPDATASILRNVYTGHPKVPTEANEQNVGIQARPGFVVRDVRSNTQGTYILEATRPVDGSTAPLRSLPLDYQLDTIREQALTACKVKFDPASLVLKPGFYPASELLSKIAKDVDVKVTLDERFKKMKVLVVAASALDRRQAFRAFCVALDLYPRPFEGGYFLAVSPDDPRPFLEIKRKVEINNYMKTLLPDYYRSGAIPAWIDPGRFFSTEERLNPMESARLIESLRNSGKHLFEENVLKRSAGANLDRFSVSCYLSLSLNIQNAWGSSTSLMTTFP